MVVPLTNLLRLILRHGENAFELSKNSGIVIRRMTEGDVPALVGLHSEVFKGYNATIMGTGYLKCLYHTLSCNPACISIVALEGGKILGWIGGVGNWPSFEGALTRYSILRAPTIFISILKNRPMLLAKAFSVVWRVFLKFVRVATRGDTPGDRASASGAAALLVIGVAPWRQNQGLGQLMMKDFHRRLLSKGFTASSANTFADNESGNRAFQKAGYRLSWAHDGVNHYFKYLSK